MTTVAAERGGFLPRGRERLPDCGSTGRAGQLICLDCGERRALRPRRRSRRPHPAAIALVAIVVTAGASVGLVIDGVNDGRPRAEAGAAEAPTAVTAPAVDRARAQATKRRGEELTRRTLAEASGAWPAGRSGYTVVLVNTADRAGAERLARSLSQAGEDAGVIASDKHPNLGAGLFLVYVGAYDNQVTATAAAARLGESHKGAYPQFIQGQAAPNTGRPAAPQSP